MELSEKDRKCLKSAVFHAGVARKQLGKTQAQDLFKPFQAFTYAVIALKKLALENGVELE